MATRLYLSNTSSPFTPATLRGAWNQTSGHVARALITSKRYDDGVIDSVAITKTGGTQPHSILLGRFVSGPLAAQTITGNIEWVVGVDVSNGDADGFYHVHVYVTQGDSDTPRGTLLTNYQESTPAREWPSTDQGWAIETPQAVSSLAIQDGDRIVVELGVVARNTVNRVFEIFYGTARDVGLAATADLTHSDTNETIRPGWIEFSNTLTEQAVGTEVRVTQSGLLVLATTPDVPVRVTQSGLLALVQDSVPPLEASVSDSVTVTDAVTENFQFIERITVLKTETISVADVVGTTPLYVWQIQVADNIVVQEATSRLPAVQTAELIGVTDVVTGETLQGRLSVFAFDAVTVAEGRTVSARNLRLTRLVLDNILITEVRQATLPPKIWDGSGSAPPPGTVATGDYWVVGI